ncbi:MAG: hypothetical protein CM15mP45_17510 [Deltaproteobacteria bacterium]|nr:MAG: hypothetical protein CM15mP45_17510 [Deltaproteobacteria bacterium]
MLYDRKTSSFNATSNLSEENLKLLRGLIVSLGNLSKFLIEV